MTAKRPTADELAVEILLSDAPEDVKQARLTAAAKEASDIAHNRFPCPECGHEGPHEDNGGVGIHLAYCCAKCGEHFDDGEFFAPGGAYERLTR